jgi:hypothetical protein
MADFMKIQHVRREEFELARRWTEGKRYPMGLDYELE